MSVIKRPFFMVRFGREYSATNCFLPSVDLYRSRSRVTRFVEFSPILAIFRVQ